MSLDTVAQLAYDTITARLQVVSDDRIRQKLRKGGQLRGYWGTAPTGRPHFGYMVPLVKVAECVAAGCNLVIYFADAYAYLVNHDVSQEVVAHRTQYYRYLITAILQVMGVDMSKVELVTESTYSMTPEWCRDVARVLTHSTQAEVKMVGLEITNTNMMSPLLCPIHQALSEVYTGSDFQLGGGDQATLPFPNSTPNLLIDLLFQLGMFQYADKILPRIGYESVSHLSNIIVPGLRIQKMSASAPAATKIEWLDSPDIIREKMDGISWSEPDGPAATAILPMLQQCIFPLYNLHSVVTEPIQGKLVDGSAKEYTQYGELERDLRDGRLVFDSLRPVVIEIINKILAPIREEHAANEEWRMAEKLGYNV